MGNENDTYVNHDVFHFRLISEPTVLKEIESNIPLLTEVVLTTLKPNVLKINQEKGVINNLFQTNKNAPNFHNLNLITS